MGYENKFYSQHKSLTFDDVLIQPTEISHVESRLSVDLSSKLTKNIKIKTPILASPMDRVVNLDVALIMDSAGASACFHRFQDASYQLEEVKSFARRHIDPSLWNNKTPVIAAVSAQLEDQKELKRIEFLSESCQVLVIDTAMGTNIKVLRAIEHIKKTYPHLDIIAGNVVTPEGCMTLINAGADGIRTGIGNGSGCLTRIQTGVGRGQLSTIIECSDVCKKYGVSLISDGGHYKPGDVAKAIAAGADIVMMGSPLAGHNESPGTVYYKYKGHFFKADDLIFVEGVGQKRAADIAELEQYKQYRGMASKEAQEEWKGSLKAGTTYEGIQKHFKIKGPLIDTINNYIGGLRSSLSYCNSTNIEEFQKNAKFEKLSLGALRESYER